MTFKDINYIPEIKVTYNPENRNGKTIKLNDGNEAYEVFKSVWDLETILLFEEFKLLLLNRNSEVMGVYHMARGCYHGVTVNIPLIFGIVLKSGLGSFMVAHNHPSGNLTPSEQDNTIARCWRPTSLGF